MVRVHGIRSGAGQRDSTVGGGGRHAGPGVERGGLPESGISHGRGVATPARVPALKGPPGRIRPAGRHILPGIHSCRC